jgi:HlyD family secretion protein
MKRTVITILIAFIIVGLIINSLGCSSEADEAEAAEPQIISVQRGDLAIEITAVGNLALSRSEDLAFDLFYQEGTVEEVLVEEGDIVAEGQDLASLDTEEWEDELKELRDELTAAERALTTKERALVTADRKVITLERTVSDKEDDVIRAERQVTAEELDLSQAQVALDTAEYNLGEIDEVKEAQDTIDEAELNLELARMGLTAEFGGDSQSDFYYWNNLKVKAETELAEAKAELQEILTDNSITLSKDVALVVAEKQLLVKEKELALEDAELDVVDAEKAVDDARYALETAQLDVENAEHDVADAKLDVEEAKEALADAQEKLEEAKDKSPIILAPFDGFITKVNVEGGDEVLSGTVAVQLADPEKFEADILVSEMDIMQVELGGQAWVQVDAMSGLTLPAEVTHIAPTATIQSGVVNYQVKVELQSLEAMAQERQAARQEAMQKIEQGELPDRLKQAIEEGQLTQEQAEEIVKGMQEAGQQGQVSSAIPEEFQLREGLTVTVTIVVEEKTDVLLVPNSAITGQGGQTYVQVVSADGNLTEREIQTGISDYQFTEVTSGLDEGEQIAVPQGAATTSTTEQGGPRGGIMFGPPPGGPPR